MNAPSGPQSQRFGPTRSRGYPVGPAVATQWRRLPARTRGAIAGVATAVGIAVATALGQQATTGSYDPSRLLNVAVATFAGAMVGFLHGLALPQE